MISRMARLGITALLALGCSAPSTVPAPRAVPVAPPSSGASGSAQVLPEPTSSNTPARPGVAQPGWLGVSLTARDEQQPGVVVSSVLRGSPADRGGLLAGDVVLGVNDERIQTPEQLSGFVARAGAGARLNLMLERQGAPRLIAVQLGANPGFEGQLRLGFVDAAAPEFEGVEVALGGIAPSLHSLKGRVVVLEFWASWCVACRALMPTLNAWHARFRERGGLVVSITTDPTQVALQHATALGVQYPVLSDPDALTARAYQAFSIPTLFVIDRAGVVRDVAVGYDPARLAAVEATLQRLTSGS